MSRDGLVLPCAAEAMPQSHPARTPKEGVDGEPLSVQEWGRGILLFKRENGRLLKYGPNHE